MIFASLVFLYLFLPLNLILYFVSKKTEVKHTVLLVFSLVFYAWGRIGWMLLLVLTAYLDWRNSLIIQKHRGTKKAKFALFRSLIVDIGIFVAFKYTGFLASNFNLLFGTLLPVPDFSLPIGISFYTFQTLTYVIDVYRGDTKAQPRFKTYLLYLSMYFQLVAGPIVRYTDVEKELASPDISFTNAHRGIVRFMQGLCKKVLLADTAGLLVAKYMDGNIASVPTLAAWLGMIMYTMQLYFDFSGYSDMAIGLGLIFGFHFPENFNYPYVSLSVSEFWRRWHITLGSFFRDYVYIPLGGNRKRVYFNLLVVWFLTGLWHGASWNFIIWGLYNGAFIMLERRFKPFFERLRPGVKHVYLLLVVNIGFVFFHFTSMSDAMQYIGALFGGTKVFATVDFGYTFMQNLFFFLAAVLLCTPLMKNLFGALGKKMERTAAGLIVRDTAFNIVLGAALIVCTAYLAANSYSPFLYFQF